MFEVSQKGITMSHIRKSLSKISNFEQKVSITILKVVFNTLFPDIQTDFCKGAVTKSV